MDSTGGQKWGGLKLYASVLNLFVAYAVGGTQP